MKFVLFLCILTSLIATQSVFASSTPDSLTEENPCVINYHNQPLCDDDDYEFEMEEYPDEPHIKVSDFVLKLQAHLDSGHEIEKVRLESCSLDHKALKSIYEGFFERDAVKEHVGTIDLSWNSIGCDESSYSILLQLLNFPQLKFLNLNHTGFHRNIQKFSQFIPQGSKDLLKKVIFESYGVTKYGTKDELAVYDRLAQQKHLPLDWKAIHEEFYGLSKDEKEIRQERDAIQMQGLYLSEEKNRAFSEDPLFSTLDPSYDGRMLSLMKSIIDNYHAGEKISALGAMKETWARNSLKNLVISAGLLTKEFTSQYDNVEEGFKGGNFWNDLRFLYHFFQNNSHSLSKRWIKRLIESQGFKKIICDGEICSQNHRLDSYPLITHLREQYLLKKAIDSIDRVSELSFDKPHHQSALLRAFAVLGEACTQKNLSPYTKRLSQRELDWAQLIHIRDIIVHPEHFDQDLEKIKAYERLESYFEKDGVSLPSQLDNLFLDLKNIKEILEATQQKLSSPEFENPKRRDGHYMGKFSPRAIERSSFISLSSLEKFYGALQRHNYETTKLSLDIRLKREVSVLQEIFDIPGKEALKDAFPEEDTNVPKDALERRVVLLKSLSQEPERIDAAFYHHGRIERLFKNHSLQDVLKATPLKEYYDFGKFIRHGDDKLDSSGITPAILIRYTHILFYEIMPHLANSKGDLK